MSFFSFRFVPYKPGRYTVDVRCGGQSIENSPFVMRISEAETVSVKVKEFEKQVKGNPKAWIFSFFCKNGFIK